MQAPTRSTPCSKLLCGVRRASRHPSPGLETTRDALCGIGAPAPGLRKPVPIDPHPAPRGGVLPCALDIRTLRWLHALPVSARAVLLCWLPPMPPALLCTCVSVMPRALNLGVCAPWLQRLRAVGSVSSCSLDSGRNRQAIAVCAPVHIIAVACTTLPRRLCACARQA